MTPPCASDEMATAITLPLSRDRKWRSRILIVLLLSAVAVIPCFWQSRIQAGDLSSHIYNAWLASLIEQGKADGLTIVSQRTNVLFDLALSRLFKIAGADIAQRIAVPASVLVFVWGAFAWLCAVSRRRPWFLFPCLMMLAYGWVFHMGFFNFYLSLGLCLWALAFTWNGNRSRMLGAIPLLALACAAHLLPVAWAAGVMTYMAIARRIRMRHRVWLTVGAVVILLAVRLALPMRFATRWSLLQVLEMTGADQLWVFGSRYGMLAAALLMVWIGMFFQLTRRYRMTRTFLGIPFQLCLLSATGVLLVPAAILLPGYNHALWYISDRMSLVVAVLVCSLLASVRPAMWHKVGLGVLALLFFIFLYRDTRELNRTEDKMQAAVSALPAGERVVSAPHDPMSRVNGFTHIVDRVCVGRCFSYANYEPSTAQFRVRAMYANPIVVSDYADSFALQNGSYVTRKEDRPISEIYRCGDRFCIRLLVAAPHP